MVEAHLVLLNSLIQICFHLKFLIKSFGSENYTPYTIGYHWFIFVECINMCTLVRDMFPATQWCIKCMKSTTIIVSRCVLRYFDTTIVHLSLPGRVPETSQITPSGSQCPCTIWWLQWRPSNVYQMDSYSNVTMPFQHQLASLRFLKWRFCKRQGNTAG